MFFFLILLYFVVYRLLKLLISFLILKDIYFSTSNILYKQVYKQLNLLYFN